MAVETNPDMDWITGRDPSLRHKRFIAGGGFAVVHEVISPYDLQLNQ
jgi:hypothetical protein